MQRQISMTVIIARGGLAHQKMAQNEPEKNIPSTTANATSRSAKRFDDEIHFIAHSALALTHGTSSMALSSRDFSALSRTYVSISSEYVSECTFSIITWNP